MAPLVRAPPMWCPYIQCCRGPNGWRPWCQSPLHASPLLRDPVTLSAASVAAFSSSHSHNATTYCVRCRTGGGQNMQWAKAEHAIGEHNPPSLSAPSLPPLSVVRFSLHPGSSQARCWLCFVLATPAPHPSLVLTLLSPLSAPPPGGSCRGGRAVHWARIRGGCGYSIPDST